MAEDRWGAGSTSREIASCQQGWQLWPHRPWHVATNVGAGLPREAPRGRRSISKALKIPRQALREAPRGRRSISKALKIPRQALRDAPRGRRSICASPQNPSQAPGSPNPISRQTYRNPEHHPIPKAHQAPYQPAQPPASSPLQPSLHYGTTPTHYQQPLVQTPRYWPPALPG